MEEVGRERSQRDRALQRIHEMDELLSNHEQLVRDIDDASLDKARLEDPATLRIPTPEFLRARTATLTYSGVAIFMINAALAFLVGPGLLLTNMVVAVLLLVSALMGVAVIVYARSSWNAACRSLEYEAVEDRARRLEAVTSQLSHLRTDLRRIDARLKVIESRSISL